MAAGDHPEMDNSEVLNGSDHQKYQILLGMLNWIVIIGRLDIAYDVSLLACFAVEEEPQHQSAIYLWLSEEEAKQNDKD
eukprot:6912662-Ditylum_brightwellii.AAC.1